MEEGILHLGESDARRLLLARAVEDADPQGKVVSEVEREQLEREALEASRPGPEGIDFSAYLRERARRLLAVVAHRQPRMAALQEPGPWRSWLLWGLPLAACLLGVAIDRIDNPQQVNMLSPALVGVLFWNLGVYLLLLAAPLLPPRPAAQGPLSALQRWLAGGAFGGRSGHLRADVTARFQQHWWAAAGAQEALWAKQLLHLAAAGWAVGLAISIVVGGVVREYRVGWESTLLDVGHVHAVLSALFAPVVALLPFEPFSVADLQRMAFRSGKVIGLDEARRWVWMYIALLGIVVVAPRLLLAAWAAWRRRRLGRALRIDLRDPYYVQLLARVSPARVTIAVVGAEGGGREAWQRMLREVADHPPPAEGPWTVLRTTRGDVLRVFEVPAGYRPPEPAVAAHAGGGAVAAQAWLQELLGRFKGPVRAQASDAAAVTLADTDLLLLLPASPVDLEDATRLLHWVAQPALVLAPDDEVPYRSAVQRLGLAADVLPLARTVRHWLRDATLLEAAAARIANGKRAGFERLAAAWRERGTARFAEAMRLVAAELVRAARDTEEAGTGPAGLRQFVHAGEREAAQRARVAAREALLGRLRAGEAEVFAGLVRLHRTGAPLTPVAAARLDLGFSEQRSVDTPQAGMAGAATGAAMGAGIDLLAGGMTLGAATALGAMIGGGAAYAAAAWKNRGVAGGPPQVQPGDELLQTLTESLLLAYLAVAHRLLDPSAGGMPSGWRSEVVAAVEARQAVLSALWQHARSAAGPDEAVPQLARELESIARGLLARV